MLIEGFLRGALLLPTLGLLADGVCGQAASPRTVELSYVHDSGWAANGTAEARVVLSFDVHVAGATSLRLSFSEVSLAGTSPADPARAAQAALLRITSHQDGAVQELDAREVLEWQGRTAYFNGDTVQVDVFAAPHTGPSRVLLERVEAELSSGIEESQCGGVDDRQLSTDPRTARVLPIGCSSFMIDDCEHCFLTAGHCLGGTSLIQFDVPLSLPNGNLVHPDPSEQFSVDPASVQGFDGLIGNDWGYFGVFPNSNTGLSPAASQGNWYGIPEGLPAFASNAQLRVTGYGADTTPLQLNQVQQTAWGPWTGVVNGWELYYEVDTTGGSSGSPIVYGGTAIGIHTNGGCDVALGNSGTGITLPGLRDAITNPLGVCAGTCDLFTIYCAAKVNSQGCLPAIAAVGTPSSSAGAGTFVLSATNVINEKAGLLFYGLFPSAASFLGGTLCVNPPIRRTPLQFTAGNVGSDDCSGTLTFDFGAWSAAGIDPNLAVGETVYAQFHYRDPASTLVSPAGLSNAVSFELLP